MLGAGSRPVSEVNIQAAQQGLQVRRIYQTTGHRMVGKSPCSGQRTGVMFARSLSLATSTDRSGPAKIGTVVNT